MKTFCDRLKTVRGDRTLKEVGRLLDTNYQTYQRYESGEREPDLKMLHRIGDKLGVSVDWLLGLPDAPSVSAPSLQSKTVSESDAYWRDLAISQQATIGSLTMMLASTNNPTRAVPAQTGGRAATKIA